MTHQLVFVSPFKKGPLVFHRSWLYFSAAHVLSHSLFTISLSHAMFTLQLVGGSGLATLPAQQEAERRVRERWEGLRRVDGWACFTLLSPFSSTGADSRIKETLLLPYFFSKGQTFCDKWTLLNHLYLKCLEVEKVLLHKTWKFYIEFSGKQENSDKGLKTFSSKVIPSLSPAHDWPLTSLHYLINNGLLNTLHWSKCSSVPNKWENNNYIYLLIGRPSC